MAMPENETAMPIAWRGVAMSRNMIQANSTMIAGSMALTSPALTAVVKCRPRNMAVEPTVQMAAAISASIFQRRRSTARSALRWRHANGSRITAASALRQNVSPTAGTTSFTARPTTMALAQASTASTAMTTA